MSLFRALLILLCLKSVDSQLVEIPVIGDLLAQAYGPGGLKLPQLTDFIGGDNFGFPRGKGCIPFVGDFVKILFADCEQKADTQTFLMWGKRINSALKTGKVNLIGAARETCRLQAERQLCGRLSQSVISCDILGAISTATQLQQAKERCNKIKDLGQVLFANGGLNNPAALNGLFGQIGNLVGGELAGGFFNHFLG